MCITFGSSKSKMAAILLMRRLSICFHLKFAYHLCFVWFWGMGNSFLVLFSTFEIILNQFHFLQIHNGLHLSQSEDKILDIFKPDCNFRPQELGLKNSWKLNASYYVPLLYIWLFSVKLTKTLAVNK